MKPVNFYWLILFVCFFVCLQKLKMFWNFSVFSCKASFLQLQTAFSDALTGKIYFLSYTAMHSNTLKSTLLGQIGCTPEIETVLILRLLGFILISVLPVYALSQVLKIKSVTKVLFHYMGHGKHSSQPTKIS